MEKQIRLEGKSAFVHNSWDRERSMTKMINVNIDKLLTDQAKLSYIDELRTKHRVDKNMVNYLNSLAENLGYIKKNAIWEKIRKKRS